MIHEQSGAGWLWGKFITENKKERKKHKMTQKLEVSRAYNKYPGPVLDETTTVIVGGLTGNLSFPALTVPLPTVTTLQTDFREKSAAAAQGGTQLTAAKNAARQALLDALDANAMYVQAIARYDLAMLLSSGYQATSTNRARVQLPAPTIVGFENEMSTQLVVRLTPIANAYCYEVQISIGTGAWQAAGSYTAARKLILTGLVTGTIYNVRARAIGGSTGYSDWSAPVPNIVT
jgi:hypothetical protein